MLGIARSRRHRRRTNETCRQDHGDIGGHGTPGERPGLDPACATQKSSPDAATLRRKSALRRHLLFEWRNQQPAHLASWQHPATLSPPCIEHQLPGFPGHVAGESYPPASRG